MALVPVIFFAVYSNFTSGLKVWTKVIRSVPEEDLNIFYVKIRRDLENVQRFSSIPFNGEQEGISFAAVVDTLPELGGSRGIGQVRLYYDGYAHALIREMTNYSQLHRESPSQKNVLLQKVSSFEFSFLSRDPLQTGYSWSEQWKPDPKKLPVAVKLSFTVADVPERQERIIFIPVGGKLP